MSVNHKLHLVFLVMVSMALFQSLGLHGQTLTCNAPSSSAPLQVAIDEECTVFLIPDVILEAPQTAPGDKRIIVRDNLNNVLAEGLNELSFDGSSLINETLSVTILDVGSGNFCVGYIMLVDNLAPEFAACQPVQISCNLDTSSLVIGEPVALDNCTNTPFLYYDDEVFLYDCDSLHAGEIQRKWTAVDDQGNVSNCVQQIILERPSLSSIVFPDDITLSCDNPNASADITGRPTLHGKLIRNFGFCDLRVGFTDDTTATCGATEFQIVRTWRVTQGCTNTVMTESQIILILDNTPPSITCADDISFQAVAGQCFATVSLPVPTVSDNCDGRPDLVVSTSYGATGLGPHPFVPVGTHTAQYVVIDECGNSNLCTINITVTDDEVPTAVCSQAVIGLTTNGMASVRAEVFDEGSEDNCSGQLYYKAKKTEVGTCNSANGDDSPNPGTQEWFDDEVVFCCDELGTPIEVTLRVYEVDPGPGPVDPAREQEGGDLYGHISECSIEVQVQDRVGPSIICPSDVQIDCSEEIGDLSKFGSPQVLDNCASTLDSNVVMNLNDCGIGEIRRIFTAIDNNGNRNSCTQVITIVETDPYVESDIQWPVNYTSQECGDSLEPEDLPEGARYPEVLTEKCGHLQMTYEDDQFITEFPACYKILRYWTVIDWCIYDVNNPGAGGRFTHVQVLKVMDQEAPEITCVQDTIRGSIDGDCNVGFVEIPVVTATDCSTNITITNNSPYANSSGANASGNYPIGQTLVTFSASDACGNTTQCQVVVEVADNTSPVPVCIVGLSINLAGDGESQSAVIDAHAFNRRSSDNCTNEDELQFTIRRSSTTTEEKTPPTTTELIFDCDNVGTNLIEFWVTDAAGNSDYCETFITIQDLDGNCETLIETAMVAGGVITEAGLNVEEVKVTAYGHDQIEVMTNEFGHFELTGMRMGQDYTLVPEKEDQANNGLSTLDLILISQHILGVRHLGSPYKVIAADIDRSRSITTFDLIQLRKLILHIEKTMPGGGQPWRFVEANYAFKHPQNPFLDNFPEIYNVNDLDRDNLQADFVAIKLGDVNDSAVANRYDVVEGRTLASAWELSTSNQEVQVGETISVDITGTEMTSIFGYQFTLDFDTDALEFIELIPGDIPNMDMDYFGLQRKADGLITTSWTGQPTDILSDEPVLFTLTFKAKTVGELKDLLGIGSSLTTKEAYNHDLEEMDVALYFEPIEPGTNDDVLSSLSGLEVYQNQPNPFFDRTSIPFDLSQSGTVSLKVFDSMGQLLFEKSDYFTSGRNQILLSKLEVGIEGVFYYQIETQDRKVTKKMIVN